MRIASRGGWMVRANPIKGLDLKLKARISDTTAGTWGSSSNVEIRDTAMLHAFIDAVPEAMVLFDRSASIQSCNAAAERLFGFREAELRGRSLGILIPALDRDLHESCMSCFLPVAEQRGHRVTRVVSGLRKNGSSLPAELSVSELRHGDLRLFSGFFRDLTERQATQARVQELQEDLVHVSRLRAMGQMAAAISHELNQPLTATTNYLSAAARMIDGEAPDLTRIRQAIALAANQTMRSGEIIRRLRAFVARGEVARQSESIGRVVEEATALALVSAKEQSLSVCLQAAPDLPSVLVDRVQIQQVLLNLVRNAVEAMEGAPRRSLSVQAALWESMIVVSVSDTGTGIPPAIEAQLFQPFVTTKRDGMGIGLSVCRTIVEAHGGRLWAEPNPDGGTIFRFTVPLVSRFGSSLHLDQPPDEPPNRSGH